MKVYVCTSAATAHASLLASQALRLVLHTISTSAARYGRYIQPLLSLSIDFYVRVFVRVYSSANEVKKAIRSAAFSLLAWKAL